MRRSRLATLAAAAPGLLLPACSSGPEVVVDWRMVDRTLDRLTDDRPGRDREGSDGVVDDYDAAVGPLVPGRNGNISTRFPADGRYEVVLDACATVGVDRFSWTVDEDAPFGSSGCAVTMRLIEGPHRVRVDAEDAQGARGTSTFDVDVKDVIVVGLGDSFSAGSGNARGGLVSLDYDNLDCVRSGRSGQAWAALELERRDPRTSVTFIHLACGGARAGRGLLEAHAGQPPQLLELSEILPEGERVDFVSFTIGGNDVRFSEIVGQLVGETDAPLSSLEGERLHDRTQRQLGELRDTLADVAACFGAGFEGRPCVVRGPSGRPDDGQRVALEPIPVTASHVVHVTYPDLATRFVRDENGVPVPGPDGRPGVEICPSGAVEAPGDLVDGRRDGYPPADPANPRISLAEWSWGETALLHPQDPAPGAAAPLLYAYQPEAGGAVVPLPILDTLNSLVMESEVRFGWTASDRWWSDSRGHGYCSPPEDNWGYRLIFHPNDAGYQGKAAGLADEAVALGFPWRAAVVERRSP